MRGGIISERRNDHQHDACRSSDGRASVGSMRELVPRVVAQAMPCMLSPLVALLSSYGAVPPDDRGESMRGGII